MSLLVISNKDNLDWEPLSDDASMETIGCKSGIVRIDENCNRNFINDYSDGSHYFTIINEHHSSLKRYLQNISLLSVKYILVHDLTPEGPNSKYNIVKDAVIDREEYINLTIQTFSHLTENAIWQLLNSYIKSVIARQQDDAKVNFDRLTELLDKKSTQEAEQISNVEISSMLLPLAAYDLYMQSDIRDERVEQKVQQAANESLTSLRQKFPDYENLLKELCLDATYSSNFHDSLKTLSVKLVKPYG